MDRERKQGFEQSILTHAAMVKTYSRACRFRSFRIPSKAISSQ
jgi:hypothetical protein